MWTHGFLFYSVGIAIIIYLDAQIDLDSNSWSPFKLAWCKPVPIILSAYLYFLAQDFPGSSFTF